MSKLVRKIGLVAHDAMKKDLIEWVLWNSERLIGHSFIARDHRNTYPGSFERENILMWNGILLF